MSRAVSLQGFEALDAGLRRLPRRTAEELQGTLVRQLIATKREIARSSRMTPRARRAIRVPKGIVRILPDRIVKPRRLRDVYAEIYTTWRGGRLPKEEAASRAIEAEVGKTHYRPVRRRGLLVPAGVLRTKAGGVKKRGGEAVNPAEVPGTRWVRTKRGGVLLVRNVEQRRRRRRKVQVAGPLQVARTEVIGILLPRVRITARLDFFGAWHRLRGRRTAQYGRTLDKVIRRF